MYAFRSCFVNLIGASCIAEITLPAIQYKKLSDTIMLYQKNKIYMVCVCILAISCACCDIVSSDTAEISTKASSKKTSIHKEIHKKLHQQATIRKLYVNPLHPAAKNTNPGTTNAPLRTISAAAKKVVPGTTVYVYPGVYRESVVLNTSGTSDAPITFISVVPHEAIISGADILTNWVHEYDDVYSHEIYDLDCGWDNHYLRSQWLYIDAQPLRRWELKSLAHAARTDHNKPFLNHPYTPIDTPRDLDVNSFTIDPTNSQLYVRLQPGDTPTAHECLISRRQGLICAEKPLDYITIRDFTFSHNAGWFRGKSALEISGRQWIVEGNKFIWSSNSGIGIEKSNNCIVRNNICEWSGQIGIKVKQTANLTFAGNTIRYSNWLPVDQNWEAGSTKFTTMMDSCIESNTFEHALGSGIWLDVYNCDNLIRYNVVHDHINGAGLFSELSWHDIYRHNVSFRNQYGAAVGQSPGTFIMNNIIAYNFIGVQFWGRYNRKSKSEKMDQLHSYIEMIKDIPRISDMQVERYAAGMYKYFAYTKYLPLVFAVSEQNIIFNNDYNISETRNYAKEKTGPKAFYDNNFSDRNIYWHENANRMFVAQNRSYSYGDMITWQKESQRDTHSCIENPHVNSFAVPVWAQNMSDTWKTKRRSREQVDKIGIEIWETAMSAILRSRLSTAKIIKKIDISPGVRGCIFGYKGENVLTLWRTWQYAKQPSVKVSISPNAREVTRESGWLVQSSPEMYNGAITEYISFIPVYFHGIDPQKTIIEKIE